MERYSFFNAVVNEAGIYDREYLAEDYARYFSSFIGNGVYANPASSLQVKAKGDMVVEVQAGKAWINGYFYENDSIKNLTLDLADGTTERIDRIVVRLDLVKRKITTEIKKGAESASAIPPVLQRDANIYELAIADIKVNKNIIEITQADIADKRFDSSVCGVVSGVVDQIDTGGLFNQYDKQFNTWFENVKEMLSSTPVGNLQEQIGNLTGLTTQQKENLISAINEVNQENKNLKNEISELDTNYDKLKSALKNAITTIGYKTTAWEYNDWAKKYYHRMHIPYSEWSELGYPINITVGGKSGIAGNATWNFSSDDNSLLIYAWLEKDQNDNVITVTFLKLP